MQVVETTLEVEKSTTTPQLTNFYSVDVNITDLNFNVSNNSTIEKPPLTIVVWKALIIVFLCLLFTVGTVFGNALVCTAVTIVKKLRTPSNLLIVSLAVSDLFVGLLVLPFATMMAVTDGYWPLGASLCVLWTSLDVLLCTASILNLCAISIDRYLVITQPFKYALKRTPKRMFFMITCVWILSALITIPPLFGWKSENEVGECGYSQAIGYQIYATLGAFYLPLGVMLFVYYKIYMVSHKLAKAEGKSKPTKCVGVSGPTTPLRKDSNEPELPESDSIKCAEPMQISSETIPKSISTDSHNSKSRFSIFRKVKLKGRENKATKTLGVIMGAFIVCWLPFFILALIKPICKDPNSCIPQWLNNIFLWLGYTNSFLNPIIYARFNRDFRTPFKEIICCRCRSINSRLRQDAYADQYGTGISRRDSLRPPQASTVRYDSHGQTVIKVGNGTCPNTNGFNV